MSAQISIYNKKEDTYLMHIFELIILGLIVGLLLVTWDYIFSDPSIVLIIAYIITFPILMFFIAMGQILYWKSKYNDKIIFNPGGIIITDNNSERNISISDVSDISLQFNIYSDGSSHMATHPIELLILLFASISSMYKDRVEKIKEKKGDLMIKIDTQEFPYLLKYGDWSQESIEDILTELDNFSDLSIIKTENKRNSVKWQIKTSS